VRGCRPAAAPLRDRLRGPGATRPRKQGGLPEWPRALRSHRCAARPPGSDRTCRSGGPGQAAGRARRRSRRRAHRSRHCLPILPGSSCAIIDQRLAPRRLTRSTIFASSCARPAALSRIAAARAARALPRRVRSELPALLQLPLRAGARRRAHLRRPGPLDKLGVEHLLPAVQALHVRAVLKVLGCGPARAPGGQRLACRLRRATLSRRPRAGARAACARAAPRQSCPDDEDAPRRAPQAWRRRRCAGRKASQATRPAQEAHTRAHAARRVGRRPGVRESPGRGAPMRFQFLAP